MKRRSYQDAGLLFDWNRRDGSGGRLLIAALIALGALVALFIAFRVITPESTPIMTRPQQILVLNPAIPAERALIHKAMDRSFALLPAESTAGTLPAAADLPDYHPQLSQFELKPLPLISPATHESKPTFVTAQLPPPSEPSGTFAPPPTLAAKTSVLTAIVEGEAASRADPGVNLGKLPLVDPNRPRFRLAVDAEGRVLMALPLVSSEDPEVMEQLREKLLLLQFAAADKAVQWAEVRFRWKEIP
jgi:hypothetical protein